MGRAIPRTWTDPDCGCIRSKGNRRGQWSVWVSENWRIVFRFEWGAVVDGDLVDHHGG